jgi:hypothetical protein
VCVLALIAFVSWLISQLTRVVEDVALARLDIDVADNRRACGLRAQVMVFRRMIVAMPTRSGSMKWSSSTIAPVGRPLLGAPSRGHHAVDDGRAWAGELCRRSLRLGSGLRRAREAAGLPAGTAFRRAAEGPHRHIERWRPIPSYAADSTDNWSGPTWTDRPTADRKRGE